jgi:hypothetical protein
MKGKTATTQVVTSRRVKGLRTPQVHMGQLPGTTAAGKMPRLKAKVEFKKPKKTRIF